MQASRKALSKLSDFAKKFGIQPSGDSMLETEFGPFYPVQEALLSDLNTPEALGRCFRLVREMGEAWDRGEFDGKIEELVFIVQILKKRDYTKKFKKLQDFN